MITKVNTVYLLENIRQLDFGLCSSSVHKCIFNGWIPPVRPAACGLRSLVSWCVPGSTERGWPICLCSEGGLTPPVGHRETQSARLLSQPACLSVSKRWSSDVVSQSPLRNPNVATDWSDEREAPFAGLDGICLGGSLPKSSPARHLEVIHWCVGCQESSAAVCCCWPWPAGRDLSGEAAIKRWLAHWCRLEWSV